VPEIFRTSGSHPALSWKRLKVTCRSNAAFVLTISGGFVLKGQLLVINRNEISGDRKAFKWLSIKYSFDFSNH
jgi:hypothetical protein